MNIPGVHPFSDWRQSLRTITRGGAGFHLPPSAFAESTARAVCFCSFVGLFVSRKVVDAIGYPDPRWFLYGDDVDYTLRICEAGFQFVFDPNVRFVHDCATLINDTKAYQPVWKVYYLYRNLVWLYRRVAGRLFWPALAAKTLQWLAWSRHYPISVRRCYFRLLHQALVDGIRGESARSLSEVHGLCKSP